MPIPSKPSYDHGSTGTEPTSARDYSNGDPLDADEFDYYLYTALNKHNQVIDALNEIDGGSIVVGEATHASSADDTTTVKGNDIDVDGDGKVNSAEQADNATTVKGNDIDSDGDGQVDAADQADSATDADNLGGTPPSGYATENVGVEMPVFATKGDVPGTITKGEVVFVDGVGLFYEDGT